MSGMINGRRPCVAASRAESVLSLSIIPLKGAGRGGGGSFCPNPILSYHTRRAFFSVPPLLVLLFVLSRRVLVFFFRLTTLNGGNRGSPPQTRNFVISEPQQPGTNARKQNKKKRLRADGERERSRLYGDCIDRHPDRWAPG